MSVLRVYVVYAAMPGGWERIALTEDGRTLLVFERRDCADAFAQGVRVAGVLIAHAGALDEVALVAVLDKHDAERPVSFEREIMEGVPESDLLEAAFVYGYGIGQAMLADYTLASPN